MAYGLSVVLHLKPGHADALLELLGPALERVRAEDGCLAFSVHRAAREPDTIWIYEAYVSEAYHDDIHESYPEIRRVLGAVPDHLSAGGMSLMSGEIVLVR